MIIIDTNVVDSALRSKQGASHVVLRHLLMGHLEVGISTALFLEYEDVLKREARKSVYGLEANEIDVILTAIAAKSIPVPIRYVWRPQLPDANDDVVLECAINAQAEFIVTFNFKDFKDIPKRFGIHVLTPCEFLKRCM